MSVRGLLLAPKAPDTPPWLITFVDLVLVVLSFFILMFSMTRPDPARYISIAQSYVDAFKPGAVVDATFVNSRTYVQDADADLNDLAYLEVALKAAFARSANLSGVQFRANEQYLVISLPPPVTAGGAEASASLAPALFDLGGVFANIENRLVVIGLADPTVEGWAAGLRRADVIATALTKAGYDQPVDVLARTATPDDMNADAVEILMMADQSQTELQP